MSRAFSGISIQPLYVFCSTTDCQRTKIRLGKSAPVLGFSRWARRWWFLNGTCAACQIYHHASCHAIVQLMLDLDADSSVNYALVASRSIITTGSIHVNPALHQSSHGTARSECSVDDVEVALRKLSGLEFLEKCFGTKRFGPGRHESFRRVRRCVG